MIFVFFFQAEAGIRDVAVTGVQTCALPILRRRCAGKHKPVSLKFTRLKATLLSLSANFANPSIPSLWLGTAFRTKNSVYRFCPVPFDFTTPMSISDRKSTRLNSSHGYISYAVFCLQKKT